MYERTGHATVPYSGDPATMADAISQDVIDSAADRVPLAPEFGLQELVSTQGAGLIERLGAIARGGTVVGGVLLISTAVGTGLNKFVMSMQAPDDAAEGGTWSWNEVTWEPYGTEIYFGATVQQRPGAYVYNAGYGGNAFPIARWFESPCDFSGFSPPTGARIETGVPTTAECAEFSLADFQWHLFPIYVDYPFLLETDFKPTGPFVPFDAENDVPDYTIETPPDPGAEAVEGALEGLDADGYDLLRSQLDQGLTPGAQREEDPIRVGVGTREEDRECKAYFGDRPGTDPGARAPGARRGSPDWDFDMGEFEGVYNPLISSSQTVDLRWGTVKWGYRHIVIGHGWERGAAERTGLALQTDASPTLDPRDPFRKSFRYFYDVPDLPEGMHCRQRVVVSYRTDDEVPIARHIITSFIESY